MTMPSQPGWYDDPQDSNALRYWDGQNWTQNQQQKTFSQPAPQPVMPPPSLPGYQPQWQPAPQRSRRPLIIGLVVGGVLAVVVGIVVVVFVVIAANTKWIVPDRAAKVLTDGVTQKTGYTPTDVSCPSGVEAEVGNTFDCHFTGPDGRYTSHMKVTKVNGDYVEFDMHWSLGG